MAERTMYRYLGEGLFSLRILKSVEKVFRKTIKQNIIIYLAITSNLVFFTTSNV